MEPEKPDKPEVRTGAGVTVAEEAPPSVKENIKAELDLLKKKAAKESVLQEIEELKDPTKSQIYKSMFRVKHEPTPRSRSLECSQRFPAPASGQDQSRCSALQLYVGNGRHHVLSFHRADLHRHSADVLLPPVEGSAFQDILYLENDVPFGKLLRNMHRWGAHLMVITTWLHMLRVVLTGSYKTPREFNWSVGVVLLVLTLLLSFTGYLLPDDQLGFWAVTVGTNMARATPGLGHEGPFGPQLGMSPYNDVRFALLGGSIVDANALLRSYIWHCIAIPTIVSVLLAVHFWRVRKDGGISGPAPVQLESEMRAAGARAVKKQVG